LKSVSRLPEVPQAQVLSYLKATGLQRALATAPKLIAAIGLDSLSRLRASCTDARCNYY
jgi:hypothetical protein